MIELTVAQIAEIVGGAVADISPQDAAHRRVTGTVEFDSRAIGPGGLFRSSKIYQIARCWTCSPE